MGMLKQAGYAPLSLDLSVEALEKGRLASALFVGISVPMHTALSLGFQIARAIRTFHPHSHICFFGLYASLNAEYLLEHVADTVIGGEIESPLLALIDRLEQRDKVHIDQTVPLFDAQDHLSILHGIPGVSTNKAVVPPLLKPTRAERSTNDSTQHVLKTYPIPFRATLPSLDNYAKLDYQGSLHLVGNVETSRGCLHTCLHCPIVPVYQGRFLVIPESVVIKDIQQQVKLGATHITFADPDFLNGPRHSLNILRHMHQEFPDLTFDCTTKIEHILKHHDLFSEFASLGCLFVVSAVESFSDHVLQHLEKGHLREDIFRALSILKESNLTLRPSFVAFTPWTSLEDYLEMLDLIACHDFLEAVDPVQLTVRLLIPPGSALLTPPATHPDPIQQFITDLDQGTFQYRWKHPDERMDVLYKKVVELVEEDAKAELDFENTFYRIQALAYEIAAIPPHQKPIHKRKPAGTTKPPRLTEPWFCCAEPTKQQFESLGLLNGSYNSSSNC